jgi:hypothetical protein
MAELSLLCNSLTPPALPPPLLHPQFSPRIPIGGMEQTRRTTTACAAKSGGFSLGSVISFYIIGELFTVIIASLLFTVMISELRSFN